MEQGSSGGQRFMRNVGRLIALFIKRHPKVVGALRQHDLILKHTKEVYNLGYNHWCCVCGFMLEDSRFCLLCSRYVCLTCAPISSQCIKGCCDYILHPSCDNAMQRCYMGICEHPHGRPSKCQQCTIIMCTDHVCHCPYCKTNLCEPCVLDGHQDCEKKKKFIN